VLKVVLARIEGLDAETREVLVAAAAVGVRFEPGQLVAVCGGDQQRVPAALSDAVARRLVEPRDGGHYAFLHDRIREALLSHLDPPAMRRLHQRIAEALDTMVAHDLERVYAVACHYTLGETERTPDRAYHTAAPGVTSAAAGIGSSTFLLMTSFCGWNQTTPPATANAATAKATRTMVLRRVLAPATVPLPSSPAIPLPVPQRWSPIATTSLRQEPTRTTCTMRSAIPPHPR
jgi:hypothetical protein